MGQPVEWFDERAEINSRDLRRAVGDDPNREPTFFRFPDFTEHRDKQAALKLAAGESKELLAAAAEEMLNWSWNQEVVEDIVNMDGEVVEARRWMPEKAIFSVMVLESIENSQSFKVLVHVTFPEPSERDFEKFWCDHVWPEVDYMFGETNPVEQSFKGPAWDKVTHTATTFEPVPVKER